MTYNNGDTQTWEYDVASNLIQRKTAATAPAEQFQNFTYDERNRKKTMSWSDPAIADRASFAYDAAGRMTEADNDFSEVTRTYDPAGRLKTDAHKIAGFASRKVQYKYSQDALLLRMWVGDGNGYDRTYAYDSRARLEFIKNTGDGASWFQYGYDKASNEVKRYNFRNGVGQEYGRDELNRMSCRDVKKGTATISSEVYRYDEMSRLRMVDREDGKRDRFDPDVYSGQLEVARYDLVNDANPTQNVDYRWDKAGNRISVTDSGSTTNYARNLVNQYSSIGNKAVTMGSNLISVPVSMRSSTAVVGPTAVPAWRMRWVAQDDAIASPGSCRQSASLPGNAPSIDTPPPTAATAGPSRPIVSLASLSNVPIKSGSPMPPASSPARAGSIWSPSSTSALDASSAGR
ncbi:hypothetical protein BH18VER1_BH18VER1_16380 [soil metagenome]